MGLYRDLYRDLHTGLYTVSKSLYRPNILCSLLHTGLYTVSKRLSLYTVPLVFCAGKKTLIQSLQRSALRLYTVSKIIGLFWPIILGFFCKRALPKRLGSIQSLWYSVLEKDLRGLSSEVLQRSRWSTEYQRDCIEPSLFGRVFLQKKPRIESILLTATPP